MIARVVLGDALVERERAASVLEAGLEELGEAEAQRPDELGDAVAVLEGLDDLAARLGERAPLAGRVREPGEVGLHLEAVRREEERAAKEAERELQQMTALQYIGPFQFFQTMIKAMPKGGSLIQISGCEYWTLNRTAGGGTGRVVLSWESTSACGGTWGYVGSLGGLAVARLNGGTWADEGSFGTTGNTVSGTLTSNTATLDFTATFALGTTTTSNALPVMFADVKAFQKNSGVQVEWTNLTERDMVSYTVERSADGQSWAAINQQAPRSNVNDRESYSTFDGAPFNGVNFYRIKALDISGKIVLSKTMKVDINSKQNGFAIFPNPVRGNQLSLSFNLSKGQYTVKVLNGNGQQVMIQRISHNGGSITQTLDLPGSVTPGVYNMVISGGDYRASKMFIVQ